MRDLLLFSITYALLFIKQEVHTLSLSLSLVNKCIFVNLFSLNELFFAKKPLTRLLNETKASKDKYIQCKAKKN